jgi:class 3 adenylate cyclase
VTRVVRRGRPDAGPVRAPVGPDADQVQGRQALAGLGRGVVLVLLFDDMKGRRPEYAEWEY